MNSGITNKQHRALRIARGLTTGAVLIGTLAFAPASQATISFEFDYSGNTAGIGFLDPLYGAARQAALTDVGNQYAAMFGSFFTNSGTIKLSVTSSSDSNSDTLASAGSEYTGDNTTGFTLIDVVRTKLVTGVDKNGAAADGSVDVNWGWNWQLNSATPVSKAGNEFDFYAAMNHELTHALGFSSTVGETGRDIWGDRNLGQYGVFDSFLSGASGQSLISTTGDLDRATWITTSTGGSSLYFNGANAVAANGGNLVGLYSPATWSDGSSASHLDTDNPLFATSMMKHDRDFGPEARTFSAVEVGIMQDIGYSAVTAVPEPGSYAMFLAGLGLIVSLARRRT